MGANATEGVGGKVTTRSPELWTASVYVPGTAEATAESAERDGFDGVSFGDTQHLAADPYSGLCLAAKATERLALAVLVENPLTRHPAVVASSIATVHAESSGRAVLGIGRGDSSLAYLRRAPAGLATTKRFVQEVSAYLGPGPGDEQVPIRWTQRLGPLPPVPLDIAATGPRMIALGASLTRRVSVNVGADPERVAWALEQARAAAPSVSLGAYVVVAAHPDLATARDLARGPLAAYAHLSGMSRSPGRLSNDDRAVVDAVTADYDLGGHGRRSARHVAHLTDEFVDRFGVVGPAEVCVKRLVSLVELGLDRIVLVEGRDDTGSAEDAAVSRRTLADHVLPAVREASAVGLSGRRSRGVSAE